MKHAGTLLLAVWLIATGLQDIAHLHFRHDTLILGVLALVAGVLLLFRR